MINYELLEAINANKIMKKEEKINKALLLIEQLTNKKPVLKEGVSPSKSDKFLLYRKASNSPSPGHGEYLYASGSSLVELFNNWILTMKQGGYGYNGADLEEQIANFEKNPVKFWSSPSSFYILKYNKSLSEPATKQVVDEAMKIVSKDVLAPKVVRDGLLKETIEKPIKRRFYAVTDDFEKQAKRLIAFYNDMLVLHPELKSEASKIKRALGSIEQTFTNTEMFINENKKEEQLELDFENNAATNSNYKIQENTATTLVEEMGSSDPSFENWKKALHLYDTSSLESDINRHQSNGIKPTEEQDKALTQLFRGSKVTSRFIMRSDFGRWKTAATLANYNKDCKDFGKQKVDDLVSKVLNIYTPLLQEDIAPTKDERDFVKLWWADLHPFECVELGRKYFSDKHYSDITKEDIQVIFDNEVTNKKEETLTEDVAGMTTGSMAVVDGGLGIKPAERKKLKEEKKKVPQWSYYDNLNKDIKSNLEAGFFPSEVYRSALNEYEVESEEIKERVERVYSELVDSGKLRNTVSGSRFYKRPFNKRPLQEAYTSNGVSAGNGAVGILFRGRTKAKIISPKIILRKTGTNE